MKTKAVALALGFVMVAGTALASNTGFKLNYTLRKVVGTTQNNFVAFPYFYFPSGLVGGPQNALTLCDDVNDGDRINTPKVVQVIEFDSAGDLFNAYNCDSPPFEPAFDLVPGESYSLKATTDNTVINIVGSHNNSYAKPPTGDGTAFITLLKKVGTTQNNFVSIPYHIKANNALELCDDINDGDRLNTPKVVQVIQFDSVGDLFNAYNCDSPPFEPAFSIVPGEGYSFKAATDGAQINSDVY